LPRKAQDSTASKALIRYLEKGATGRIWVSEGNLEVSVYVQEGNLLAAEAPDDALHYLRRLAVENGLPKPRAAELQQQAESGEPVFGYIVDESRPELLDKVLQDRFYDNMARFMGSAEKPQFELTAGVFVDNLQMGLVPKDVLFDAGSMWDAASTVDLDQELIRGPERPRLAKEVKVIHALGDGGLVGALLPKLPYEPIAGRALIATMLSSRVLALKPREEPVDDDVSAAWEDELPDEDTEMVERESPASANKPAARQPTQDLPPNRTPSHDSDDEDSEVIQRVAGSAVAEAPPPRAADVAEEPREDDTTVVETAKKGKAKRKESDEGLADLRTASDWIAQGGAEIEDDLDAFADHDEVRGSSGGGGSFTTAEHNLDRVEVGVPEEDEDAPREPVAPRRQEPEELEADELPQAKYGAPTLTDDLALDKIEVAQDALGKIADAFDEEKGAGAGRAALQLLVEGSPGAFSHLFADVQVNEDNRISAKHMLRNLYQRPLSEHRKLLNDGLIDLIERALSMGADELSDEAVDAMLEHVAGYRQRIGF
jgi:hypothetical protein